jgi:hypothetical protein
MITATSSDFWYPGEPIIEATFHVFPGQLTERQVSIRSITSGVATSFFDLGRPFRVSPAIFITV